MYRPGKTLLYSVLCLALSFGSWPGRADAQAPELWVHSDSGGRKQIELWFFWSRQCAHCLDARPYVHRIAEERPWLHLHDRELSNHPEHVRQYIEMAGMLGQQAQYVPAFLFCGEMHVGWDSQDSTGARFLERLNACRDNVLGSASKPETVEPRLALPMLGELGAEDLSLPVMTLVIAGLDAFNPCAFFVLLFLLSLLIHLQDRRRMLLIGGIYVVVSGAMYFAFMVAWLNLFLLLGNIWWVTMGAGGLAVILGLVNIKDFFAFKKGVSLSIPDSRRADIYRRSRNILNAGSLPAMIGATLILAVAANLYELLCTAGFPMVYSKLLTLQVTDAAERYAWLALYNIVYVLPLAIIVLIFARTMGGRKLSERHGRLLKLLSGSMMLGLGVVLLMAPQTLGNAAVGAALLGGAVAVTCLAAWLKGDAAK